MSARTCLLCGKTLVRIRVGAGGDFCSREHRNQYQLRRGMDCLAEANKVSTLARRRETPKALFGEATEGASSAERREFANSAPFGRLAALNPDVRRTRKGGHATLFPTAAAVAEPVPAVAPKDARPNFGTAFAASTPAVVVPHGFLAGRKPGGLAGAQARGPREMAVSAAYGNALRVSTSAGFRLKAPEPPKIAYSGRTDYGGLAGMRSRAFSRLVVFRQECRGAKADAQLAYIDMGFSPASDAPARLVWLLADRATYIGRERREL